VEQALRCYMIPDSGNAGGGWNTDSDIDDNPIADAVRERSRPFGGFCLTLDTETFSFEGGQRVRFGVYQIRGIEPEQRVRLNVDEGLSDDEFRNALDAPYCWGLFFDPLTSKAGKKALKDYAEEINQSKYVDPLTGIIFPEFETHETREFIEGVLYPWAEKCGEDLLFIGHNLAFDIGAFSTDQGLSTGEFWYGGFTMKLCGCSARKKHKRGTPSKELAEDANEAETEDRLSCFEHPPVRAKPLGAKKRIIGWRKEGLDDINLSRRKNGKRSKPISSTQPNLPALCLVPSIPASTTSLGKS